ncbi:helix-turn-helix domain-containing protein [Spirosoma agri]|uniref:Helix-turn-helix domain-containing protein n=1 Tax=Spirosoma agri TaxID=1987381 RepID=A0A6M0ILJ0_9BACT|nr:helix-turn-helix domain-containing protein [Spirosoma agri]NEU68271.1 helix-turn-helix domain-containing protein [Spirosoma agri]
MDNPFETLSTQLSHLQGLVQTLSKNVQAQKPVPESDDPITVKQAAEYLHLSQSALYQNIDRIPHRKRHGKLYFFKSQLRAYLDEGNA